MSEDKFKMARVSEFKDPENRWRLSKAWGLDVNPAGWVWADELERKIADMPVLYAFKSPNENVWECTEERTRIDSHRIRHLGFEEIIPSEPQTDRDWLKKIASTSEMGEIFMCLKEIKKYLETSDVNS